MLRKIVKLPINLLFSIFVSANYFKKKDDKRLSFLRQIYNFRVTNRSKLLSSSPHTTQHFCTNTHLHNSTVCLSFFLSLSKTFYWLFFALLYIQISLSISFSIYLSLCLHFLLLTLSAAEKKGERECGWTCASWKGVRCLANILQIRERHHQDDVKRGLVDMMHMERKSVLWYVDDLKETNVYKKR